MAREVATEVVPEVADTAAHVADTALVTVVQVIHLPHSLSTRQ